MDPQPMGKVRNLKRLAGRVACRSTVRWSRLWAFLGFCLLTAVVCGPAVDLPRAQGAGAVAGSLPSARAPARIPQRITFDQPSDTAVGQPVRLTASSVTTTTPAEGTGLLVSFRSDTSDLCTVSGTTVTPTAPGFCVITATQGGDRTYAPALDVARAFRAHAGPEPQTITFKQPPDTAVGQPVTLSASTDARDSSLVVSFRSDTPGACTVSGTTATPTAVRTCTITASQGGSDRYAAARPVPRSFQAHTGIRRQAITFNQPPDVNLGQSVTLSASTDAKEPLDVSFRSDSPMVCTVSDATVTTVAAGTCTVTAYQGGSATYAPADASKSFTVTAPEFRSDQEILFDPVPGTTVGVPIVLTASSRTNDKDSPTGLAVSYTSRNQRVCTVSGATVVPRTGGRCVIIASQDGNAQYLPAKPVGQEFPVARADQTVTFTPPASATIDQSVDLTATASSWLPVTYASSTPEVCTVSGATVATTAAGTCTVIASQSGDAQYAPARPVPGSFPVGKIPQTISFTPPRGAETDQRVALSASATSKLAVSFSSATPGVCTVSGSTATTIKAGTCAIIASQAGDDRYAPARDAVRSFRIERAAQTITFTPPDGTALGRPVTLSASATSGLDMSYRTDTPAVCTVSGATVTPATVGTCTITASQPGNGNYAPAQGISRSFPVHRGNVVAVGKIPQAIAFAQPPTAAVGRPVPLAASATSGLVVSFRSDAPSVCTVSGDTVPAIAAGTCTVTASQAGDDRYLAAPDITGSFQVNTGHQAQTITFTPPSQVKVGEAATLTASATSGLMVAFRADTPRICTVSGSTLTPIAPGTCTVTASQGGSDRYGAARDIAQSFDVASATSAFPGNLTMVLGAVVFAVAGATTLVRRARRRSHRPPEPAPTVSAAPVPGPPALVSVQNTGAGVTHTVRIESSPGASVTRIKEGRP